MFKKNLMESLEHRNTAWLNYRTSQIKMSSLGVKTEKANQSQSEKANWQKTSAAMFNASSSRAIAAGF